MNSKEGGEYLCGRGGFLGVEHYVEGRNFVGGGLSLGRNHCLREDVGDHGLGEDVNVRGYPYQHHPDGGSVELTEVSSCSSLSWTDEYEENISAMVGDELRRMEKVLIGEEDIPGYYDSDEYGLWMKTYQPLR